MPDRAPIQLDGTAVTGIDLAGATVSSSNAIVLGSGHRIAFGTSAGPVIVAGSGSPEGVYALPMSSLYLRTDTSATSALYVKQSVTAASTGWSLK